MDDPTPRPPALDALLNHVEGQLDHVEMLREAITLAPADAVLAFDREVVEMLLARLAEAEQAARLDHEVTGDKKAVAAEHRASVQSVYSDRVQALLNGNILPGIRVLVQQAAREATELAMRDVYRAPATLITDAEMLRRERQPSRFSATPEDIDAFLRSEFAERPLLEFYQWVGGHAVAEALDKMHDNFLNDPVPPRHQVQIPDIVGETMDELHPRKGGDPFPSKLPVGAVSRPGSTV